MYERSQLKWDGDQLRHGRRVVASIVPDTAWPAMWRVSLPGAPLTDMVNRTRAKDAAMSLALAGLNARAAA